MLTLPPPPPPSPCPCAGWAFAAQELRQQVASLQKEVAEKASAVGVADSRASAAEEINKQLMDSVRSLQTKLEEQVRGPVLHATPPPPMHPFPWVLAHYVGVHAPRPPTLRQARPLLPRPLP